MTTTITVDVLISSESRKMGTAKMQIIVPDEMLSYISADKITMDLPSLVKVALKNFQSFQLGKLTTTEG